MKWIPNIANEGLTGDGKLHLAVTWSNSNNTALISQHYYFEDYDAEGFAATLVSGTSRLNTLSAVTVDAEGIKANVTAKVDDAEQPK